MIRLDLVKIFWSFFGEALQGNAIKIFKNYIQIFTLVVCTSLGCSSCTDTTGCTSYTGSTLATETIPFEMYGCRGSCVQNSSLDVKKDQLFRVRVNKSALTIKPRKYRVIVRVDPRFEKPLVFIARGDYTTTGLQVFQPDWNDIYSGLSSSDFASNISSLSDYAGRSLIEVEEGDVISIRQISATEFYDSTIISSSLGSATDLAPLYSSSGYVDTSSMTTNSGMDNSIVYTTNRSDVCDSSTSSSDAQFMSYVYSGLTPSSALSSGLPDCTSSGVVPCSMKNGVGISIGLAGVIKKEASTSFINIGSSASPRYIYYITADKAGELEFDYGFDIEGTVINSSGNSWQFLDDISSSYTNLSDATADSFLNGVKNYEFAKFYAGRYLLEIQVGTSNPTMFQQNVEDITIKYEIMSEGVAVEEGDAMGLEKGINPSHSGNIRYTITNPHNDISGNMVITSQSYLGSSVVSNLLYNKLVKPLTSQFRKLSEALYKNLIEKDSFQMMVKALMGLTIMFYGGAFASGMVELNYKEVLIQISRVAIVGYVLQPSSWNFFNEYLFNALFGAIDYYMNLVTNSTAIAGNPFGFIDPILSKYLNPDLWTIIATYLMWVAYGYIIPGLMLMWGIFFFMSAILESVIAYVLGMVFASILISLAPLFITFILFNRTKTLFNQWLNILIGSVVQPTIAMVFILFVDNIATDIINEGLQDVCNSCVLPLAFNFRTISEYLTFSIPGICLSLSMPSPFEVPIIKLLRTAFMFVIVMSIMRNILVLANAVSSKLTSVGDGDGSGHAAAKAMEYIKGEIPSQLAINAMRFYNVTYYTGRNAIGGFDYLARRTYRAGKSIAGEMYGGGKKAIDRAKRALETNYKDSVQEGKNDNNPKD
ncbi:MAG: type IV secretion system protein [Rickettsiaceae bacterium]|nr:type IV secretion system protein [Rickettsiaceae bacterium]